MQYAAALKQPVSVLFTPDFALPPTHNTQFTIHNAHSSSKQDSVNTQHGLSIRSHSIRSVNRNDQRSKRVRDLVSVIKSVATCAYRQVQPCTTGPSPAAGAGAGAVAAIGTAPSGDPAPRAKNKDRTKRSHETARCSLQGRIRIPQSRSDASSS